MVYVYILTKLDRSALIVHYFDWVEPQMKETNLGFEMTFIFSNLCHKMATDLVNVGGQTAYQRMCGKTFGIFGALVYGHTNTGDISTV